MSQRFIAADLKDTYHSKKLEDTYKIVRSIPSNIDLYFNILYLIYELKYRAQSESLGFESPTEMGTKLNRGCL